ncbi:unnamed protein product [Urochloa humidicola]
MRPKVLLATLTVLSILAALPLGKGSEEEGGAAAVAGDVNASPWPCCDQCDFCFRSNPPKCRCQGVLAAVTCVVGVLAAAAQAQGVHLSVDRGQKWAQTRQQT